MGRRPELSLLVDALQSAKDREGSSWILAGPSGIGKTRLARSVEECAEGLGFEVLWGHCLSELPEAFFPFREALRALPGGGNPLTRLSLDGAASTHPTTPGPKPPESPVPASQSGASAPESAPLDMVRYLERIERRADERPLVIIVDDLQWADPLSLQLFRFLARNIRSFAVVLVGTLQTDLPRPAGDSARLALPEILEQMHREGTVSRLELPGLTEPETARLMEAYLQASIAPLETLGSFPTLLRQLGGNPYFTIATLEAMLRSGELIRVRNRIELAPTASDSPRIPLPENVRELASRRLDSVNSADLQLLRGLAIVGPEFSLGTAVQALSVSRETLYDTVTRLAAEDQLLSRVPGSDDGWAFTRRIVHEVVLGQTPIEARESESLRLARWWAANRPEETQVIARLFHESRNSQEGIPWVRRALATAVPTGASWESIELLAFWLQELLDDAQIPLAERLAESAEFVVHALEVKGDSPIAQRLLRSLQAQGPTGETAITLNLWLAWTLVAQETPAARRIFNDATPRLPPDGPSDSTNAAQLRSFVQAALCLYEGDYQATISAARLAIESPSPSGERPWLLGTVYYYLGWALLQESENARALAAQGKLADFAKKTSSPRLLGLDASLRGAIAEAAGDVRELATASGSATEYFRRLGDPSRTALSITNEAGALVELGSLDEAQALTSEGQETARQFDLDFALARCLAIDAEILLRRRKNADAYAACVQSLSVTSKIGLDITEWRTVLAEILLQGGNPEAAQSTVTEVLASEKTRRPLIRSRAHRVLGRVLAVLGRDADAQRAYDRALEISEEVGNSFEGARTRVERSRLESRLGNDSTARALASQADLIFSAQGATPEAWSYAVAAIDRTAGVGGATPTQGDTSRAEGGSDRGESLGLSVRVVLHLARQGRLGSDEVAPPGFTQSGISQALGRPQSVFAKVLQRLEASGVTSHDTRHVKGAPRRLKVYRLTALGESLARDLRSGSGATPAQL